MKKALKWILLIFAAIIVLFTVAAIAYVHPMLSMNPAGDGLIAGTNIFAVKNRIGTVYFIKTDNGYIMIDAGSDPNKLESSLKEQGIDINDVKWIFLTHSDTDHVAALTSFPNAVIHMSEDELPLINGTVKRAGFINNSLPSGVDINKIILLSDKQELSFNGTNLLCIKAPGHTNGTMLYLADGKYLFTGDAFKVKKGIIGVHPYTMDSKLSKKTMEQLKDTIAKSSLVLTSHYGYHDKL